MTEPVIVKNSLGIAFIALLQGIVPAFVAVSFLYFLIFAYDVHPESYFHGMAVLVALLMLLLPYPTRHPRSQLFFGNFALALAVLMRWAILLGTLLAIAYITKFTEQYSRRVVLTWAVVTPAMLIVVALVLHEIMRQLLSAPENARRAVFAGYNEVSRTLAKALMASGEFGMAVQGYFDDRAEARLQVNRADKLLGKLTDLARRVKEEGIEVIFIALPVRHLQRVNDLLDDLRDTTASIYYAPDIVMYDLIQARSGSINGIPVITMCETPFSGFRGISKRVTDVVISCVLLVFLAPLMLGIIIIVRATSPGPAIFKQRRYGLNGEEIIVYKFRTMRVVEDGAQIKQASRGDERTTTVGRFLRKYSLDELPQLVNVLQGRMSLVGPRPHAVAHNEMYRKLIKGYMLRHKVLPGITGLAQVNGLRGETSSLDQMEARVRYDLEYLRNWSVGLDLRIIAMTALRVWNDGKAF